MHLHMSKYLGDQACKSRENIIYELIMNLFIIYNKYYELAMRSVERGICPITKSSMNELFHGRMHCMHDIAIFPLPV